MLYVIALINWGCGPLSSLTTVLHGMVRVAGWELTEKIAAKGRPPEVQQKTFNVPKYTWCLMLFKTIAGAATSHSH